MNHDVEALLRAAARAFDLLPVEETRGLNRAEWINDFIQDNYDPRWNAGRN